MDFHYKTFDIGTASNSDWALLHDFRRKNSAEAYPGDPIDDDETTETYTKGALDQFDITVVIASEKDKPHNTVAGLVMMSYKEGW
ncbi:MAG: hypothetical protein P1Q69_06000 [Candidatus Thorarchaeota archaeon]|nr:hypothetical protein [Candidatus Thorarchaeota archaeon]